MAENSMSDAQVVRALAQYAHGGGGGGGSTVDVNIWNVTEDESLNTALPSKVQYVTGYDGEQGGNTYSDPLPFEHVTSESNGTTFHGVKVSGLPVGAAVAFTFDTEGAVLDYLEFGLTESGATEERFVVSSEAVVLAPVGDLVIIGRYVVSTAE